MKEMGAFAGAKAMDLQSYLHDIDGLATMQLTTFMLHMQTFVPLLFAFENLFAKISNFGDKEGLWDDKDESVN